MRSRWVKRVIEEMRAENRASAEGLLRILDEMRRNDGPSAAGA